MDLSEFSPGNGYSIRKYLASGAWKSAFRGNAPGKPEDIALLCYHSGSNRDIGQDLSKLLSLDENHPFVDHLASFYFIFRGDDKRIWLAEELLARPLTALSPLRDVGTFARLARDLCRGLKCIRDQHFVHRDLKLDNCGIDKSGRGKIFDLGSLTTEPGQVGCTVLSRPPEAMLPNATYSFASDVWALGATFFALSTGDYPFVSQAEVRQRAALNTRIALAKKEEVRRKAEERKRTIDEAIFSRARGLGAEGAIFARIQSSFGGEVAELLTGMLRFDEAARLTAEQALEGWTELADNFARPVPHVQHIGNWDRILASLENILRGELTITYNQLDRVSVEWAEAKRRNKRLGDRYPNVEPLIAQVKDVLRATT